MTRKNRSGRAVNKNGSLTHKNSLIKKLKSKNIRSFTTHKETEKIVKSNDCSFCDAKNIDPITHSESCSHFVSHQEIVGYSSSKGVFVPASPNEVNPIKIKTPELFPVINDIKPNAVSVDKPKAKPSRSKPTKNKPVKNKN